MGSRVVVLVVLGDFVAVRVLPLLGCFARGDSAAAFSLFRFEGLASAFRVAIAPEFFLVPAFGAGAFAAFVLVFRRRRRPRARMSCFCFSSVAAKGGKATLTFGV